MEGIKETIQESFEADVLQNKGITLVDFWAPWCGTCRIMISIIEKIAGEIKETDNITIVKCNVDDAEGVASKYEVMTLPTFIIFKDGKEVSRASGFKQKDFIMRLLQEAKQ